ncbi:dispanin subfamily A member 2b-like [Triplophysa dalaica]|uniref:dispanin subfamily A member 2b-like n=1 Tax=Triplophysa dalaica TaxID=1582913 RepID=UPI0024E010B8|nr:dispanin subfamily A member 2b-like [Triplophysa dalaica]
MAGTSDQTTFLAWSIFNTLCCCFPLGIAAIVFSCRADTANKSGDTTKARDSSRTARNLNIAGAVIGIILIIIIIVASVMNNSK